MFASPPHPSSPTTTHPSPSSYFHHLILPFTQPTQSYLPVHLHTHPPTHPHPTDPAPRPPTHSFPPTHPRPPSFPSGPLPPLGSATAQHRSTRTPPWRTSSPRSIALPPSPSPSSSMPGESQMGNATTERVGSCAVRPAGVLSLLLHTSPGEVVT